MKVFVQVIIMIAWQIALATCEKRKQEPDPNTDLQTLVIRNIQHLNRLDNKTDMIFNRLDDLISKMDRVIEHVRKEEEQVIINTKTINDIAIKTKKAVQQIEKHNREISSNRNAIEKITAKTYELCTSMKNVSHEMVDVKEMVTNASCGQATRAVRDLKLEVKQDIQRGVHDIKQILIGKVLRFPNATFGNGTHLGRDYFYIQGHVEIYHQGEWGTICDDQFYVNDQWVNDNAADTLCKMDGYRSGTYDGGRYRQPHAKKVSKIWLDGVRCKGGETDIDDCVHNPWGVNDCGHHEDVGIRCYY